MSKLQEQAMRGQIRHINVNGYVKKVSVINQATSMGKPLPGWWFCQEDIINSLHKVVGQKFHSVHEDAFYHRDPGGQLVARDLQFKRKYPNHPVDILDLPSL